jgi:hypothetical protein
VTPARWNCQGVSFQIVKEQQVAMTIAKNSCLSSDTLYCQWSGGSVAKWSSDPRERSQGSGFRDQGFTRRRSAAPSDLESAESAQSAAKVQAPRSGKFDTQLAEITAVMRRGISRAQCLAHGFGLGSLVLWGFVRISDFGFRASLWVTPQTSNRHRVG